MLLAQMFDMMSVGSKCPWSSSAAISTFLHGHVLDCGDKALTHLGVVVVGCLSNSSIIAFVPTRLCFGSCLFGIQSEGKVLSRIFAMVGLRRRGWRLKMNF